MKLPRLKNDWRGGRGATAFTLLEIMVSIALLVMIVVAIYNSWNSILKGSRVALDAAAAAQRTRITMRTLEDSLLCACMYNKNPNYYTFTVDSDNNFSALSFAARLPRSFPRGGKFGDFSVRRLDFTIEPDANSNRKNLVLRQTPLLMDIDPDEKQFPLLLAKDVSKFMVEFVDPKTGDWISEWNTTNILPKEVRISLGLGHLDQFSSQEQELAVKIIAIPAVPVRVEWQTSTGGGVAGGGQRQGLNNGLSTGPGVNSGNNAVPNR